MQADVKKIIEYYDKLKEARGEYEKIWQDIDTYVCPDKPNKLFDSTARIASHELASSLQSMLVNPQVPWFGINILGYDKDSDEEELPIQPWCFAIEQVFFNLLSSSTTNFYAQIHEFFLSLVRYGSGIFYLEESPEKPTSCYFKNIDLKECYFADNDAGLIDGLFRCFKVTYSQATKLWPKENIYAKRAETDPLDKIEILHACRPNPKRKGYESTYIDLENEKLLNTTNLDYFPFMVTRWSKEATSAYGISPATIVMPDIKMLNQIRQGMIKSAQKHIEPPLAVPKEGFLLPLHTTPGSVNFYRNGIQDKIEPLLFGTETNLPVFDERQNCHETILKAFHTDLFQMPKIDKEMTASEAMIRNEEQMRAFGAIIGRIETECLSPLIHNIYRILAKYQKIPPIMVNDQAVLPDIDIDYISPLAKAQKASLYSGVEQVIAFLQRSGIQNIYPEIYDNLDWDKVLKLFFELKNVPEVILRDEKTIESIRAQRQQMQLLQGTPNENTIG